MWGEGNKSSSPVLSETTLLLLLFLLNSTSPNTYLHYTHGSLSDLSCVISAHLLTVVARHHYFSVGSVHAQGVTVNCASTLKIQIL